MQNASVKNAYITDYKLTVQRGAFHYDSFLMIVDEIRYIPDSTSKHKETQYNRHSETKLERDMAKDFFAEIENRGFWELKNRYRIKSSCTSELIVTLQVNGKSKTVICDDFERDCPNLIKYIDKKVVELEGNNLKRIYLPG